MELVEMLYKNIAYIGSSKHFVFVCVCVCVCVSVSSYWSMSSPDDKLSENIWFVWSKTLYSVDKCGTTNNNRTKIGLLS